MTIKTKRGAKRAYNALLNKVWRNASGGLAFGLDWRTLAITDNTSYTELKRIESLFDSLPD